MSSAGSLIQSSEIFINIIIGCLSDAVGDDIVQDIASHGLITQNSTPSRIWDFIYKNICLRFPKSDVIANPTKRGPWEMVPAFERATGTIYSLMREERYISLKKELPKRSNAHYVDAFIRSLNNDLIAPQDQITLFSLDPKHFSNEDKIPEIVDKILTDLGVPNQLVNRHALILFKSFNNELASIRCCVMDSNLDIVEVADWSSYIKANESVVSEKVAEPDSTFKNQKHDLQYKKKAKDRMGQKTLLNKKHNNLQYNDIN